ncbi:hypothetical protein [Caulifigura coniformis]|uniref:hypothetical protein n=1 Tax=Caulifigura coniformis TaxID=2527983 RepID=UPI0011AAE1DE|nr:hypothetical protein [Caulifigura coniformis]
MPFAVIELPLDVRREFGQELLTVLECPHGCQRIDLENEFQWQRIFIWLKVRAASKHGDGMAGVGALFGEAPVGQGASLSAVLGREISSGVPSLVRAVNPD